MVGSSTIGAVDIGGTKTAVGIVESTGRILARRAMPTAGADDPAAAVADVFDALQACGRDAGVAIAGIGIGCTGPVDPVAGTIGEVDFLPAWRGFELSDALTAASGMSVALENDADAGALAEWRWGAGRDSTRFVYVSVGTGIGTGMVFDGRLYRGARGAHPEFGHHTIDDSGPECYCGARGCWEILASGPALEAWHARRAAPGGGALPPTARDIVAAARAGDPSAIESLDREARFIGIGLANVATAYCPDAITLGGGLMSAWDLLADVALDVARRRCGLIDFAAIRVDRATLGDDAPLLGAAQAWFGRFANPQGDVSCSS